MAAVTSSIVPSQAFAQLPPQLRDDLLGSFDRIVQNYAEGRWEPAELNGGKLCEAAFSICEGIATGTLPARAQKPSNIVAACKALEAHTGALRSVRIQIPRMVVALYEVRNQRNVGHLGGEVDPNHMDALLVLQMAKWIVAELVRVLHGLPVDEASEVVEALVEREVPLIWEVDGKRRVLDTALSATDKTLLLLHGNAGPLSEVDLRQSIEYSNSTQYRRAVLGKAHADRLVEYDLDTRMVTISPKGIARIEDVLRATRAAA